MAELKILIDISGMGNELIQPVKIILNVKAINEIAAEIEIYPERFLTI